jgi:hypothetical protein
MRTGDHLGTGSIREDFRKYKYKDFIENVHVCCIVVFYFVNFCSSMGT